MNMREFERQLAQRKTLESLGFTAEEAAQLRRISMTLQRWHELECGTDAGCIERDEKTNKPYMVSDWGTQWGAGKRCRRAIPDRETGALKRLAAIIKARNERKGIAADWRNYRCVDGTFDIVDANGDIVRQNLPAESAALSAYIQGDPRGAALYIIRPGDVPEGEEVGAYYSRGICVY